MKKVIFILCLNFIPVLHAAAAGSELQPPMQGGDFFTLSEDVAKKNQRLAGFELDRVESDDDIGVAGLYPEAAEPADDRTIITYSCLVAGPRDETAESIVQAVAALTVSKLDGDEGGAPLTRTHGGRLGIKLEKMREADAEYASNS